MKGLILTYIVTVAGSIAALRYPLIGLQVYFGLAVLRPQAIFGFAGDLSNLSFMVGVAVLLGWTFKGFGSWQFGRGRPVVLSFVLFVAWYLLGQPRPTSAYGVTHSRFAHTLGAKLGENKKIDVDDAAFAMIRFEGGKSLEVAASWAINQTPQQQGTICRVYGEKAAIEVYTPEGAVLYSNFDPKGDAKPHPLKPPKVVSHPALMRHFRDCILGKAKPIIGAREGVQLMQMLDAIYKSSESGKSVEIKSS